MLGRARIALAATVAVVIVTLAVLGFGWRPAPIVLVPVGVVVLAGFVAWIVLGEAALRRMRAERERGYSTALDVPGIDFRHPVTGELERAAGEVVRVPREESLIARMLRVPPGTWLAAQQRRDEDTPG